MSFCPSSSVGPQFVKIVMFSVEFKNNHVDYRLKVFDITSYGNRSVETGFTHITSYGNRSVEIGFTHTNVYDDTLENYSDYLPYFIMSVMHCIVGTPCPAYYEQ